MLVCLLEYLLLREDDYFRLFPSYQQRSSIVMAADAPGYTDTYVTVWPPAASPQLKMTITPPAADYFLLTLSSMYYIIS